MEPAKLQERLFGQLDSYFSLYSLYLGNKMGWLQSVADHPDTDAEKLAQRTESDKRYCQEWLNHMATSGFIKYDSAGQTYSMPESHKPVLVDMDSPYSFNAMLGYVDAMGAVIDKLPVAFKTGKGVPYGAYKEVCVHAICESNRPHYETTYINEWLKKCPEIYEQLEEKGGKILDVGCGSGVTSIVHAKKFTLATVDGVEPDATSYKMAMEKYATLDKDLQSRLTFRNDLLNDAKLDEGSYDLVTFLECLHDIGDPVAVLKDAKKFLKPGGVVFVADERATEKLEDMLPKTSDGQVLPMFDDPDNGFGRIFFGFSILHCLPCSLDQPNSRAVGTCMRPSQVEAFAKEAGYSKTEIVGMTDYKWRLYKITV